MQVSTTCRSTVNRWIAEACGSSRIRSHSGSKPSSAPVSSSVSHTASSPRPAASSRTSACRASAGHGSGSGGHSRTSRAAVAGASTTSRSAATAAARSSSAGSRRAGRRRRARPRRADSATPGRDRLQLRAARVAHRRGPGQHGVDPPPGQPREVGDPAAELAHVPLRGGRVVEPQPARRAAPTARGRPGRWASGVSAWSTSRTSSSASRDRSRSACGDVDQPGRDQRLEHGRVAQPALGLLEVGHREVGELADQLVPLVTSVRSSGSRSRASRRQRGQHRRPQPQGQVGVAGEVAHVEQPERHLEVVVGRRDHLGQRAHRVVEPGAGVPERVPDLLRHRARVDARVVDQHHVEVGVRRELAAAVAADRDQGDADLGAVAARRTPRGTARRRPRCGRLARRRSSWLRSSSASPG